MEQIFETIAQYGPFPLGVAIGIWLARSAYSQAIELLSCQLSELREEKKQMRETIVGQQSRIDILHDQAYNGDKEVTK